MCGLPIPSGAKAPFVLLISMYGLKPVPFISAACPEAPQVRRGSCSYEQLKAFFGLADAREAELAAEDSLGSVIGSGIEPIEDKSARAAYVKVAGG
jgi:hypothetical protein